MRAAVYVRKSTTQEGRADAEKSVAEQERACRALITRHGWTLDPAHVYADDATSGALFGESRPGFHRLLEAIRTGAKAKRLPFDVLVTYDGDRLGRDRVRTDYHAVEILDAGVRIFFANGDERVVNNATDSFMQSAKGYAAEVERERAIERTRDALRAKARAGHLTGTVAFGYDVVIVGTHKELLVNPAQAEIVRRLFEWSAEGYGGITRLAHRMNVEYPGIRKWSATGVRDLLHNRLYIGQITYGRKRKMVKGGKTVTIATPESEWITTERPELRIIPDALWQKVQQRHAETFKTYLRGQKGRLSGRPEMVASKYLLSGMVECGVCGGRMVVWSIAKGAHHRYLKCWRRKARGPEACSNHRSVPLQALTDKVIEHFRSDVLTPERVEQIGRDLAADASTLPEKIAAARAQLDVETRQLETEIARFVSAIAKGGPAESLVIAIQQAETAKRSIEVRRAALESTQLAIASWQATGHDERVTALLGDWREALMGEPVVARQVLRKLLVGHITVTPIEDGPGVWYSARGTYSRLIAGTVGADEADAENRAVTIRKLGVARPDDLGQELVALAKAQRPGQSGGSRGPTS
jgi:site-specific DNA recombinase